jgi:hypothetical protein
MATDPQQQPQQTTYRIVSRYQVNRWDDGLQATVPGFDVKALWFRTGTVLHLFIPAQAYTPDNVDVLIREAGARDDAIGALGA